MISFDPVSVASTFYKTVQRKNCGVTPVFDMWLMTICGQKCFECQVLSNKFAVYYLRSVETKNIFYSQTFPLQDSNFLDCYFRRKVSNEHLIVLKVKQIERF